MHESGRIVPEAEVEVSRWNLLHRHAFFPDKGHAMTQTQKKSEPKLDAEVEETFPASDPPSYMGSAAVAGAPKKHTGGDVPREKPVEQSRLHVDLNRASEEELGALPALGPERVRALLKGRPFDSWEDLKGLPDFDGETIAALRKGGAHIGG